MTAALLLRSAIRATCGNFDYVCKVKQGVKEGLSDALGNVTGSVVDQVASSFTKSAIQVMKAITTVWTSDGKIGDWNFGRLFSPRIADGPHDPTSFLAANTAWLVNVIAVFGILLVAGQVAWQRRGEPLREAMSGLIRLVLTVFAVTQVVNLLLIAGDEYSTSILAKSTAGEVEGNLLKITTTAGIGGGLVLIIALLAILSGIIQLGMMFVRSAMLVLLAGALPLAAAASIHPDGRQWYRKLMGWLLAFVLYKPVAATVYATAFNALMGDSIAQMQGVILLVLAVLVLPALMRFIVPMVAAAGGGGSGVLSSMGGGAVATGARMVPSFGGGGSGGGKSGSHGAGGSDGQDGGNPRGSKNASGQPGQQGPQGQDGRQGPDPSGSGGGPTGKSGGQMGQHTAQGAQMGGPHGAAIGAAIDAGKAGIGMIQKIGEDATGDEGGPSGSQ
ncbi:hypothetical protein BTM25_01340 [Actinomadura rubteroloni]|uniref:Type IV secretion system protein n=1 Tax=Actinomadura rubteroloni TaxID=1926885 RepID=A0A2P4UL30_9ACTN|nr:hypothetical protein [Actinomadura rubteroloni]POM25751.1 hypothetical protein BTM25_01340 [Actinomadura rubteroloni]